MDSYIRNWLRRRRARQSSQRLVKALIFAFILFSLYVFFSKFINHSSSFASPAKNALFSNNIPAAGQNNTPLGQVIQNALVGTKGAYGIAVKNLKTSEAYFENEHKIYKSGSLYKLWVMATVYKQIQDGALTEDDLLSEDISTLNSKFNIDPEDAELTDGTITLTTRAALNQMITISHNYAALLLTEKVKLSSVAGFLKENGFTESEVGTNGDLPTSTPFDITLFFEKLYKGELANEQYTKEMIDLLKNQKLNDKLPKYLPKEIEIAHKTGELDYTTHDAGIVYAPAVDYIIVVLSDSNFPQGAEERIARLSKTVYDYFQTPK